MQIQDAVTMELTKTLLRLNLNAVRHFMLAMNAMSSLRITVRKDGINQSGICLLCYAVHAAMYLPFKNIWTAEAAVRSAVLPSIRAVKHITTCTLVLKVFSILALWENKKKRGGVYREKTDSKSDKICSNRLSYCKENA